MPNLYVLAGANGSGKTTWYYTAIEQKFIDASLTFINVDIIVRKELQGGYTEENYKIAADIAREKINNCLISKLDFMIESNLALQSDYTWIENLKLKGYDIILFFLGTDDVQINYSRVLNRIKEGGHNVPESIILHRYNLSLSYLKSKILLFKTVYLIDNSFAYPRKMSEIVNNKIIFKEVNCPIWVNNVLYILERLSERK
jgi:predicted ABC-type ATPase